MGIGCLDFWADGQGVAHHGSWLSSTNRGFTTDWWLGVDRRTDAGQTDYPFRVPNSNQSWILTNW